MGAKKKYVPCILKYVRPISKYVGHIFCPLKTRLKMLLKIRTNAGVCSHRAGDALYGAAGRAVFAPSSTRNRHTGQEKRQARPCKGRACCFSVCAFVCLRGYLPRDVIPRVGLCCPSCLCLLCRGKVRTPRPRGRCRRLAIRTIRAWGRGC